MTALSFADIKQGLDSSSAAHTGRRVPLAGLLGGFTCDGCNEKEHGLGVAVMGEAAYCWTCVSVMVTVDEGD
jgi:hypothetical protein